MSDRWVEKRDDGLYVVEETDGAYALRHGVQRFEEKISLEDLKLKYPSLYKKHTTEAA
jgi:hypothetical protein